MDFTFTPKGKTQAELISEEVRFSVEVGEVYQSPGVRTYRYKLKHSCGNLLDPRYFHSQDRLKPLVLKCSNCENELPLSALRLTVEIQDVSDVPASWQAWLPQEWSPLEVTLVVSEVQAAMHEWLEKAEEDSDGA